MHALFVATVADNNTYANLKGGRDFRKGGGGGGGSPTLYETLLVMHTYPKLFTTLLIYTM